MGEAARRGGGRSRCQRLTVGVDRSDGGGQGFGDGGGPVGEVAPLDLGARGDSRRWAWSRRWWELGERACLHLGGRVGDRVDATLAGGEPRDEVPDEVDRYV